MLLIQDHLELLPLVLIRLGLRDLSLSYSSANRFDWKSLTEIIKVPYVATAHFRLVLNVAIFVDLLHVLKLASQIELLFLKECCFLTFSELVQIYVTRAVLLFKLIDEIVIIALLVNVIVCVF